MLFGEQLSGRHQRRLVLGIYRQEHGIQSYHGFAGTNIALNEQICRSWVGKSANDLPNDLLLPIGQFQISQYLDYPVWDLSGAHHFLRFPISRRYGLSRMCGFADSNEESGCATYRSDRKAAC